MRQPVLLALAAPLLGGCLLVSAREVERPAPHHAGIVRNYATPAAVYARSIIVPPGYETIRLPGVVADPVSAPAGGAPVYGDTEQQAESALAKIRTQLAEVGAGEADVVAAVVYLVAPPGQSAIDMAGMNKVFARHYGSPEQPNRPVRSTVQVGGLPAPGMLVEIEVTAMRKPR